MIITIMGGGAIGSAIANQLHAKSHQIFVWDIDATKSNVASLDEAVEQSELVILAVPSRAIPIIANQLLTIRTQTSPTILVLSKGMLGGMTVPHYLHQLLLPRSFNIGVWYGPMLANEINQGRDAFGIVSTYDPKGQTICRELSSQKLHITWYDEPDGVAWAGILKNCYAFGLGLSDGLNLGRNYSGALVSQAVCEMINWLHRHKLKTEPAIMWAGLGDLLATGTSVDSYNYRTGYALGRGEQGVGESSCEGIHSLRQIYESTRVDLTPLLEGLSRIAVGIEPPDQLTDFFSHRNDRHLF